jgi:hypothetical protein
LRGRRGFLDIYLFWIILFADVLNLSLHSIGKNYNERIEELKISLS